ncbi:hypothetical protein TWF569_009946 [Orbilia oligospora]|uniref:Uncharacterized protein n=1 Tax=Orbilia oligospora TaxID=2813651 RepID=A0A7C8NLP5_ORBOL|nr:hypothetical protein TWF706_000557 [Orbilia oligospora]KAF3111656.1 hypothetical protein TWF103_003589 [Orbilia oligospora]KAF3112129.1 hypothetical protein TWF102_005868 [Orbilia oligospora]KAF3118444.1 hypothetical protein TWF703_005945 [Orbilia oligospora]KAF3135279.1 hypothetical protein TWF569_009946 [Orbilia oligospora]
MAMSLHLDDLDETKGWLDRINSSAANEGLPARTIIHQTTSSTSSTTMSTFPHQNSSSYQKQIAREREVVHKHKDSTARLSAALQHLQIVEGFRSAVGIASSKSRSGSSSNGTTTPPEFGNNYMYSSGNNGVNSGNSAGPSSSSSASASGLQPAAQIIGSGNGNGSVPQPRRGQTMPAQKLQQQQGHRSESVPPAGKRPSAAQPITHSQRIGLPAGVRKASAETGHHLRITTPPNIPLPAPPPSGPPPAIPALQKATEGVFGGVLKSPTKKLRSQPKRRTQFNPEGEEVDEQRWRFHRDELFQSMEKAHWADASEHSDALAQISRDHGCVLSVNERYFFEKINGILLVAQRQSAAALRLAEKSSAENSNTLQLVKCIALMQLGDFKGAREACQPLFKIWSKDDVLKDQRTHYYLMAMILDRLGKKAEAKWYRQHIPENFRFDLWIESALSGLQTEPSERTLGPLETELPRPSSPAASSSQSYANYPPETPGSTRSDPPPFTPSDPPPPEYQVIPKPSSGRSALETLTGFNLKYENGEVVGDEVAKKRAIMFFLTEYHGDRMYDCIRALFSEQCCRGVIDVAENIWKCNSLGLIARNKGPASGEMARFLLSSGDQPYHLDSSPDGFSSLHIAAKEENFAVAESILNHVGIPMREEVLSRNNLTPLHLAAEYNRKTLIVSLLLDAGSDVNARGGPLGNTPLHYAIRGYLHDPIPSRLETIDYLLESPLIKLGQKNNNKESPEEFAKLCTLIDLSRRIKDMRKNGKAIFRSTH